MPLLTDWLMVIITAIYVIATIFICRANINSANATKEQIAESKRQFDETRRLQVMPYLQVTVTDGHLTEDGEPQCPYTHFVISDSDKDNKLRSVQYISLTNVGLGMLHHTRITWNSLSKQDDGYPAEDIVIPPQIEWSINALLTAQKIEVDDPLKAKSVRCFLRIKYEDLLGNEYYQQVNFVFIVSFTEIRLLYHHITAPSQINNREVANA